MCDVLLLCIFYQPELGTEAETEAGGRNEAERDLRTSGVAANIPTETNSRARRQRDEQSVFSVL